MQLALKSVTVALSAMARRIVPLPPPPPPITAATGFNSPRGSIRSGCRAIPPAFCSAPWRASNPNWTARPVFFLKARYLSAN